MKKATTTLLQCALVLIALVPLSVNAQTYNLVWSDEFNGGMSSAWRHDVGGGGWGNNEKQYYQPQNTSFTGSELVITAKKEYVNGHQYTSSKLVTLGSASPKSFKYGRMEGRMRNPMGQGLWPAFWMLGTNIGSIGWPSCGEIDIMEHINNDATVFGTIHWQGPNGYSTYGSNSFGTTPGDYHTYRIDWSPSEIRWFLDGSQYHMVSIANNVNSTEEFHAPMYFILNLAVAGNFPGQTVDESRLPASFFVDYVRVYEASNSATTASAITLQAENYSLQSGGLFVEGCSEGGSNVAGSAVGRWFVFNGINFPTSGTYLFEYRVSSGMGGRVNADLSSGSIQLGGADVANTGGWQNWQTVSFSAHVNAGTYNFGTGWGRGEVNVNWIRITPPGSAPAPAYSKTIEAEHYAGMTGMFTEGCSEGGTNIAGTNAGEWIYWSNVNFPTSGSYTIEYRVASAMGGRFSSDLNNGSIPLGAIDLPNTGGWQNWRSVHQTVNVNAGTYNFGLMYNSGEVNLNWIRITKNAGARLALPETDEPVAINSAKVYPTVVASTLNYTLPKGVQAHNIQIRDFQGKAVSNFSIGEAGDKNSIDLSALKRGMYLITISDKGFNKTFKIEKQ